IVRTTILGYVELAHTVWRATCATHDGIDSVTGQDRDVIPFVLIEMDLVGCNRDLLVRAGSTLAITHIAGDSRRAELGLALFAGDGTDAARRDNGHVRRVEVVPKTLNWQRRTGSGPQGRVRRVDLALRIDVESAVLFNDPAVVLDLGARVLAIDNLDAQVAG